MLPQDRIENVDDKREPTKVPILKCFLIKKKKKELMKTLDYLGAKFK